MVKSGDKLYNPHSKETFLFRKTAADTQGRYFELETHVPVDNRQTVPPHFHPRHTMRYTITAGQMALTLNGQTRLYQPPDTIQVPVNAVYHWKLVGASELRFVAVFEPAGQWDNFFESVCTIGREATAGKLNPLLASFCVLNRCHDHLYFAGLPIGVQQAIFRLAAKVGQRLGYRDYYPYT